MNKLLFVCSRNKQRSATAESMYRGSEIVSARGRGTASSAIRKLTQSDIDWSDHVFVMEPEHAKIVRSRFGDLDKLTTLHIPDEYDFNDPELREMIEATVESFLSDS